MHLRRRGGGDALQPVEAAQPDVRAVAAKLVDGPGEPLGGLLLAGQGQLGPELAAVGVQLLPGRDHGGDHGYPGDRLEQPGADLVLEPEPLVLEPAPGRRVLDPGQRRRRPGGREPAGDHEHDQEQHHPQDPRPVVGQPRRRGQPAHRHQPGGGGQPGQAPPPRTNPSGHAPLQQPVPIVPRRVSHSS